MNEQAIIAVARAYVEALENLAKVRAAIRVNGGSTDPRAIVAYGQEKTIWSCFASDLVNARSARKRTLTRLKRAVERCRPLPGQKVLFELPLNGH
jgi:hypothetical protein